MARSVTPVVERDLEIHRKLRQGFSPIRLDKMGLFRIQSVRAAQRHLGVDDSGAIEGRSAHPSRVALLQKAADTNSVEEAAELLGLPNAAVSGYLRRVGIMPEWDLTKSKKALLANAREAELKVVEILASLGHRCLRDCSKGKLASTTAPYDLVFTSWGAVDVKTSTAQETVGERARTHFTIKGCSSKTKYLALLAQYGEGHPRAGEFFALFMVPALEHRKTGSISISMDPWSPKYLPFLVWESV